MSLKAEIRQQTDIASRRHSKGVHCSVLTGPIHSFLHKHALLPTSVVMDAETGYDHKHSYMAVLPVSKLKQYRELVRIIDRLQPVPDTLSEGPQPGVRFPEEREQYQVQHDAEQEAERFLAEQGLIEFLQSTVILVFIERFKAGGVAPNGQNFDVYIESQDVGQLINGVLVSKTVHEPISRYWDR